MELRPRKVSRRGLKPTVRKAAAAAPFVDGERHRGDFMAPETRSALMARIKGKNTGPELLLAKELGRIGLRWNSHVKSLPGRPDFVFRKCRVAVFVDGDFWHGWRLPVWVDKLTAKWAEKITSNRK